MFRLCGLGSYCCRYGSVGYRNDASLSHKTERTNAGCHALHFEHFLGNDPVSCHYTVCGLQNRLSWRNLVAADYASSLKMLAGCRLVDDNPRINGGLPSPMRGLPFLGSGEGDPCAALAFPRTYLMRIGCEMMDASHFAAAY